MFEALMESYKNMNKSEKEKALINEMKTTISILQDICKEKEIIVNNLIDDEELDLFAFNESDNDYLEILFAYVKYLQELIGTYVEKTIE